MTPIICNDQSSENSAGLKHADTLPHETWLETTHCASARTDARIGHWVREEDLRLAQGMIT
jgi:hypothetical protein